ncbi:MAG TPA: hypothetical protein VK335_19325 [Bryobacteraceae bacterium]|nr:hypothetical protein [Bryobacteraceae bacterium]
MNARAPESSSREATCRSDRVDKHLLSLRQSPSMTRGTAVLVLLFAAALEAGGDALVRSALRTSQAPIRFLLFAAGAGVLFAYGCMVNAPSWDFGRLLGLYVVFFFVTAQVIAWLAFGELPSRSLFVGGILIVSGGLVIALAER